MWRGITHRRVKLLSGRLIWKAIPSVSSPNETTAFVIHYLWMGIEDLFLEIIEPLFVKLKLSFECAIGHPAALLQESHDLVENFIEFHWWAS